MNKMPEVAELLGVEMGEWFEIEGYKHKWRIEEKGLGCNDKVVSLGLCDTILINILINPDKIKKCMFRPKLNEKYYYVCDNGDISYFTNDFSVADLSIIALGNCFPSKTEAQANRGKILAKLAEIREEMEA